MELTNERLYDAYFRMPNYMEHYDVNNLLDGLYDKIPVLRGINSNPDKPVENKKDDEITLSAEQVTEDKNKLSKIGARIRDLLREGEENSKYPIANRNMFYSYDVEDIHFISISSAFAFGYDDDGYYNSKKWTKYKNEAKKWLDDDLFIARKIKKSKLIIVMSHVPIYFECGTSAKADTCKSDILYMQSFFLNILSYYNVELYLSAHFHAYMRNLILYNKDDYDNDDFKKDVLYKVTKIRMRVLQSTNKAED
jgi:hypothetical protein